MNKSSSQTPKKTPSKTPKKMDRFVPMRSTASQHQEAHIALVPSQVREDADVQVLESECSKILAFKSKAPVASNKVLFKQQQKHVLPRTVTPRHISALPESCLDAPNMRQDFYLTLVDWNCADTLAIALGRQVFLWNARSAAISVLAEHDNADWSSVSWAPQNSFCALGTDSGVVEIYDAEKCRAVRKMQVGEQRIPVTHWNPALPYLLASASGSQVTISDVRVREHRVGLLANGHEQEICGLRWSPLGSQIATGGNDNRVCIWDVNANSLSASSSSSTLAPRHVMMEHTAAVKALAWCPWQSDVLASGGGSADRHIRFWNSMSGAQLNCIDAGSQVTSLQWSPNSDFKEIVSTHGYANCEVSVWKYPSLAKIGECRGHEERILSSCVSPDGRTVCTAGADETLRFWNIWPAQKVAKKKVEKTVQPASVLNNHRLR